MSTAVAVTGRTNNHVSSAVVERQSLFEEELNSRDGSVPEALMQVFLEDVDYLYVRSYK